MAGALIVTADLGAVDFGWLEGLRRKHYPLERNRVPVHLTIFHALPPSAETEVKSRLAEASRRTKPKSTIAALINLGGGTAFRVVSPELDRIREELADGFQGMLTPQDRGGWSPHITIQNKVTQKTARELFVTLQRDFTPRLLEIHGLGLHRYLDGPWERLAAYPFRN